VADVLIGQSYYLHFDPKLRDAMQPYAPLGSLYAASLLRSRGHDVALFDAMLAASEREWDAALARARPRVAVLFEDNFNYLSKMCLLRMRQAALAMIGMARARGCTVIAAGSDASDHAELYIEQGADFVLIGEGDLTLAELADSLAGRSSTPPSAIAGLARPELSGAGLRVVRTPRRPDIKDLDVLPFPAWDLVDVDRYRAIWRRRHGYFSMNVVTTRGCPYSCNWCAKPIWGQRYNVRSPENVVTELAWLGRTYGPDHIWFADDIMGLVPGWLPRFADLVERNGVHARFKSLSRADLLLREGEVDALRRAGAKTIWIGAESGSQRILDAMDKGLRVDAIVEACRRLQAAGIEVGFFLQFGYPGEGRAEIEETLRLVRTAQPDDIGVSVSYPLPGTPFHERVRAELGQRRNWIDSNDLAMLYHGPFPTPFYRQLHRVVHHEFRARRHWRDARTALASPSRLRARHVRALAAAAYHGAALGLDRWRLDRMERASAGGPGQEWTRGVTEGAADPNG
jgi:anaerobic magnesium-protoporphyrin IX monomethyl ester cyclase